MISMTLAELFLLMLFVVWYGVAADIKPRTPPEIRIAQLEQENRTLSKQLQEAKNRLDDLENRLKWWRDLYPEIVPKEGVTGTRKGTGTGLPRCQPSNNFLADISVVDGDVKFTVKTLAPDLAKTLGDWGDQTLQPGNVLTDDDVESLLRGLSQYRLVDEGKSLECRFNYRLYYLTLEDLARGVLKFDNYFYRPGPIQLPARPEQDTK